MLYCEALFPRGSGLGTRLFPWARCSIFAHVNNVPMLAPQWVRPRIGPLLRGGIDWKSYHRQILLMGLFRTKANYLSGLDSIRLRYTASRDPEPERLDTSLAAANTTNNRIITFRGYAGLFEVLFNWDEFLHNELLAITRDRWLRLVDQFAHVPIGINVRLGNDFATARLPQDYMTRGALKTPLSWYVECLQLIRRELGFPVKAVVTSDGTREELASLLRLENVVFARPGCAISDLLLMAKSSVFIGAGGSSFAAWASFLGQMPTITHPGQSLTWFRLVNRKNNFMGTFDPVSPDPTFLEQVIRVLQNETA